MSYLNKSYLSVTKHTLKYNLATMILHITSYVAWVAAQASGEYSPASFERDGFIHCSTPDQLEGTLDKHFGSTNKVYVLVIDASKERDYTKYENLEGGTELFPHLYRKLPVSSVLTSFEIFRNAAGKFDIPKDFKAEIL